MSDNGVKIKVMNFSYKDIKMDELSSDIRMDALNKRMENELNEFFRDKQVLNVNANIIDSENLISYIIVYRDDSSIVDLKEVVMEE